MRLILGLTNFFMMAFGVATVAFGWIGIGCETTKSPLRKDGFCYSFARSLHVEQACTAEGERPQISGTVVVQLVICVCGGIHVVCCVMALIVSFCARYHLRKQTVRGDVQHAASQSTTTTKSSSESMSPEPEPPPLPPPPLVPPLLPQKLTTPEDDLNRQDERAAEIGKMLFTASTPSTDEDIDLETPSTSCTTAKESSTQFTPSRTTQFTPSRTHVGPSGSSLSVTRSHSSTAKSISS